MVAPPSEAQLLAWEELRSSQAYQDQAAAFYQEEPEMKQRVANELAKINKARASRGEPPRVLARNSNDVRGTANELGLKWKNPHPGGGPGHTDIDPRRVEKHFTDVFQTIRPFCPGCGRNVFGCCITFCRSPHKDTVK